MTQTPFPPSPEEEGEFRNLQRDSRIRDMVREARERAGLYGRPLEPSAPPPPPASSPDSIFSAVAAFLVFAAVCLVGEAYLASTRQPTDGSMAVVGVFCLLSCLVLVWGRLDGKD